MNPTLWVFGFGQFMEFFTPYFIDDFEVKIYDRKGKEEEIKKLGAKAVSFDEAAKCDYVLLGYPAFAMESLVKEVSSKLKEGSIVFDICSVKSPAVEAMIQYLPMDCHIIATHPNFWPQSGKNGIVGLKMVLCNIRCEQNIYEDFKKFFSEKLNLQIYEMTAEEHDREMAYVQWITHFIWRAIKNINIPHTLLTTPSYEHLRETGELVWYDSLDLFLSIERDNPFVFEVREKLLSEFQKLENTIQNNL